MVHDDHVDRSPGALDGRPRVGELGGGRPRAPGGVGLLRHGEAAVPGRRDPRVVAGGHDHDLGAAGGEQVGERELADQVAAAGAGPRVGTDQDDGDAHDRQSSDSASRWISSARSQSSGVSMSWTRQCGRTWGTVRPASTEGPVSQASTVPQ